MNEGWMDGDECIKGWTDGMNDKGWINNGWIRAGQRGWQTEG